MPATREVVIIGGGVAGLSAAHELKERGFEVTVFEAQKTFGGKARSLVVPERTPVIDGLPAEHGFRFFPGFYQHVTDTMARIPYPQGAPGRFVIDNLIDVEHAAYSREGEPFFHFPTKVPQTIEQWFRALQGVFDNPSLGLGPGEAAFAAFRLLTAFTMCNARRERQLDGISWSKFMRAADMSEAYRRVVVNGLTQNFVAMDAEQSSTKSVINILVRLLNDYMSGRTIDRILNGPTSEQWIDPWVRYLESDACGNRVRLHCDKRVSRLLFDADKSRITGVQIMGKNYECADAHFIAAIPVEAMIELLGRSDPEIREHAPSLKLLTNENLKVNWMSGIMFYLQRDAPMTPGHIIYLDSSWALTSISQNQFWRKKVEEYSHGKVKGIVSVIISDWFKPGNGGAFERPAQTADNDIQVSLETLAQIRAHLRELPDIDLTAGNVRGHFLDPALEFNGKDGNPLLGLMPASQFVVRLRRRFPTVERNVEPLFINTVNSWPYRPRERTEIPNLFLAADYVKTSTDLATMEGANESARRAVNAILVSVRSNAKRCDIFQFEEPLLFAPFRAVDRLLFDIGVPHPGLFEHCFDAGEPPPPSTRLRRRYGAPDGPRPGGGRSKPRRSVR